MKQFTAPTLTWTIVALAIAAASWLGGSAISAPDTAEFGSQSTSPPVAMRFTPN
jgi:hypothetical protein